MSDLDAIRDRVDIVELVGESVRLQKSGRTYKGLCPFHTEKTPSFIVSPDRRTWHCFGSCATGGDVFSFVMRRDNLDFGEAVRQLAARAGIEVRSPGSQPETQYARLIEASTKAAAFYHHVLLNSGEGAEARAYAERRGLSGGAIRDFEIGYAPEAWEALASHLRGQGYTDAELVEAGLLIQGERGTHDRFRSRLMFPIRDVRGRVAGFGGRTLGDGVPKYLNSPQTPVFDKGSLLYALDRAAEPIRRAGEAVLVEGYLDAITAHQYGYTNVVATLGTALGERHIALLKRYTRLVALALDADEAGIEATLRGEQLIREIQDDERVEVVVDWGSLVRTQSRAPVDVRIFSVPSGKDPDEAIRAEPEAWPQWVAAALPPFEFRLSVELARLDRANPRARIELVDRLLPLLAEVSDRTLQAGYLSQVATSLGVREDDVRARLNASLPAARRGRAIVIHEAAQSPAMAPPPPGARAEGFCLALLLQHERLQKEGMEIEPETFTYAANRRLFELWRESGALDEDSLPEELREHWKSLATLRMVPSVQVDPSSALRDALRRLDLRRLEEQKRLSTAILADESPASGPSSASEGPTNSEVDGEVAEQIRTDIELGRHLHHLEYKLRTGRERPAVSLKIPPTGRDAPA